MALLTLAEAKAFLGLSGADQDAQITALIGAMSAAAIECARNDFAQSLREEELPGGGAALRLRHTPIVTTGLVITDLIDGSTVDASEYQVRTASGLIYALPRGSSWGTMGKDSAFSLRQQYGSGGTDYVKRWLVTYTGGYAAVPEDVKWAVAQSISATLVAQGGVVSGSDGDFSFKLEAGAGGLPEASKAILMRYRSPL